MRKSNIKYPTGEEIAIGDTVILEGHIRGVVLMLVEDEAWNGQAADPVGVYIQTELYGLLRYSPSDPALRFEACVSSSEQLPKGGDSN